MELLFGKKLGMTQVYNDEGILAPVTVIEVGPCRVTQVKTEATDGYSAVQIAYDELSSDTAATKAMLGHFKKTDAPAFRKMQEFRTPHAADFSVGQILTAGIFSGEQKLDVIGLSKGRGFQGVMKRWDFAGQPDSHGHMMHRRPGSIGMRQFPGHVYKGRKMPGHMGMAPQTVQNLFVVKIIEEKNLILVKGSVPGSNGSTVLLRRAKKKEIIQEVL